MWEIVAAFTFSVCQPGPTLGRGANRPRLLRILQWQKVFRGGLLCLLTVLNVLIAINTFGS